MTNTLPEGLVLTRTTDAFDQETVPAGLLRAHRVAEGVWGRLVVREGRVGFVFEDAPDAMTLVGAGEDIVIPPSREHHVEIVSDCSFVVEFYRQADGGDVGLESTGLE